MFSAYTIKKVLPRLLIAAVVIQLSWWLCTEAIRITNVIAAGVEGLMYAPFGGIDGKLNLNSILVSGGAGSAAGAATTGAIFAGYIAATIAAGPGTIIGILALAATALLGALLALFLLVVRRVVILFLVLTAPVAIAAWILPGTQKIWKLWWESFTKLLMVYPMILGLIAAGRIAAYVTSKATNGFLGFFIIMICMFGPFFLIPALLKLSGAAFATITGAVNNRGKGAFDRLRNVRANEGKKNKARFMAGDRFNNDRLNAMTTRVGTKRLGFGRVGRAAYQQKMELASMEHAKSAAGQSGQHNDGMLRAQTYANERDARRGLQEDFNMNEEQIAESIAAAKANGGWGRNRQIYAAKQLAVTGTGYENIDQVAQTVARVSGGNENQIASLSGFINSTTKGQGRYELAPGYGRMNNLSRQAAGIAPTQAGPQRVQRQELSEPSLQASIAASRGVDSTTLLRGKPTEVLNFADALHQHITASSAAGNQAEVARTQQQVAELMRSVEMGYASDENAQHIRELWSDLSETGLAPDRLPTAQAGNPDDPRMATPPAPPPPPAP